MRIALLVIALGATLGLGCEDDAPSEPPPRELVRETAVDASGLSPAITFAVPDGTRSVTIVVEGAPDALYALGDFALGDGVDLVGLPAGAPGPAMRASYDQEQVGQMAGELFQSIRLGTFTHVYPYRPGQAVIPGMARLRVAADRPGPVTVHVRMPVDDGAHVLPLNLYVVSDVVADPNTLEFRAELDRLLAQANIVARVDVSERLAGTGLSQITDFTEPQEAPTSQSAQLPALVADRARAGLDVFFVESLPPGVGGLALGTPGPPLRGSYYFGIVVRGGLPALEAARITAHEAGHFLALQHVENTGISGRTYPDPLDDTLAGVDNLMEGGTRLTADQAFALSRSALLVAP